jgi:hypothetical protein
VRVGLHTHLLDEASREANRRVLRWLLLCSCHVDIIHIARTVRKAIVRQIIDALDVSLAELAEAVEAL